MIKRLCLLLGLSLLGLAAAPIVLTGNANLSAVIGAGQAESFSAMAVLVRVYGIKMLMVFWGLWLLPLGILFIRSRFLPRLLGILLIVGCFGHTAVGIGSILFPQHENVLRPLTGLAIAEILVCLWLLIKGVQEEKTVMP